MLPTNEHTSYRYGHGHLLIATALVVVERAPGRVEVQVAPRGRVLVGLERRLIGKLDLEHPHEPAREVVSEHTDQRLPMGSLMLDDVASDQFRFCHTESVDVEVRQNKTWWQRICADCVPSSSSAVALAISRMWRWSSRDHGRGRQARVRSARRPWVAGSGVGVAYACSTHS